MKEGGDKTMESKTMILNQLVSTVLIILRRFVTAYILSGFPLCIAKNPIL